MLSCGHVEKELPVPSGAGVTSYRQTTCKRIAVAHVSKVTSVSNAGVAIDEWHAGGQRGLRTGES